MRSSHSTNCVTQQPAVARQQAPNDDRAAEMIKLAVVVTNHPEDVRARTALAHVASALLNTASDATIDYAIRTARTFGIAQTLRHAAETASERVESCQRDLCANFLLFAIPILITFEEAVPESQFDVALAETLGLPAIGHMSLDPTLDFERSTLLPQLFALDDLVAMPLSVVRARITQSGTTLPSHCATWSCAITKRALKRSRVFLRFALGHCVVEHGNDAVEELALCELLEKRLRATVRRYLHSACRVQLHSARPFHEALYSGMWSYQSARLKQLAYASRAHSSEHPGCDVNLVMHGPKYAFEMMLGFFVGGEVLYQRAYRLRSRPTEDPQGCISRIAECLAAVGVDLVNVTDRLSDERTHAPAMEPHPLQAMIAVPI